MMKEVGRLHLMKPIQILSGQIVFSYYKWDCPNNFKLLTRYRVPHLNPKIFPILEHLKFLTEFN